MPIRVLTADTAAKIAAGEVVERPVSVAKELVENALDAGATAVDVEVRGGGIALLRVVDDGSGIPADEVEIAFARYATSKLATSADLEHIESLGFRGEALASIAAVSHVTVLTRTHIDVAGAFVRMEAGRVVERSPRAAPPGTAVTVNQLFRNVPARLKFLKSNNAEANRISNLVSLYALAYPEVRFSLTVEGRHTFSSDGRGDLRAAVAALYGVQTAEAMLQVEWGEGIGDLPLRVGGLASPPSVSRASRGYVTLFVNRRLIQSRALTFAVMDAYQGLLMTGRYPMAVLDLTIDPRETDVNVHPTKAEIRFRDEGVAFSAVHRAVQQALAAGPIARPARLGLAPSEPAWEQPFAEQRAALAALGQGSHTQGTEHLPETQPEEPAPRQGELAVPILRAVGQVGRTYVVSEGPDGMYLIDQHAAHERIVFDRLRKERGGGGVESQGLLEPATVEMSPHQEGLLAEGLESLRAFGFDIEPFGPRTVMLRAVPPGLTRTSPAQALLDVLDGLDRSDVQGYGWEERVLATVACHSAIRAGQDLHPREMEEMVRQLEATEHPRTCPHGRPTMLHMSSVQIQREFGRR